MRRIGDLMKDLGFNKDAPIETQKAFIRHLIQAANGAPPIVEIPKQILKPELPGEQLCFDAEILGGPFHKKLRDAR
jgi:hypothetical protein